MKRLILTLEDDLPDRHKPVNENQRREFLKALRQGFLKNKVRFRKINIAALPPTVITKKGKQVSVPLTAKLGTIMMATIPEAAVNGANTTDDTAMRVSFAFCSPKEANGFDYLEGEIRAGGRLFTPKHKQKYHVLTRNPEKGMLDQVRDVVIDEARKLKIGWMKRVTPADLR